MTTPSSTGTTIPNGMTSPDMCPMTHVASRAAIAPAGSLRSEATPAASASSSPAASPASAAPAASPASAATPSAAAGIKMTASPNRPTRPSPGSIPICIVVRSIALPGARLAVHSLGGEQPQRRGRPQPDQRHEYHAAEHRDDPLRHGLAVDQAEHLGHERAVEDAAEHRVHQYPDRVGLEPQCVEAVDDDGHGE